MTVCRGDEQGRWVGTEPTFVIWGGQIEKQKI
jgi:hypothetical protein